ncbi:MAG: U32 family peptidase [Bacilli bacterium]
MLNKLLVEPYDFEDAKTILMQTNHYLLINIKVLSTLKRYNLSIEELKALAHIKSSHLVINFDKFYHSHDLKELNLFLETLSELKIEYILAIDLAIIHYQQKAHYQFKVIDGNSILNTNYHTMQSVLNPYYGHFISNEINFKEVLNILEETKKPSIVQVFGKQKIFYSKRHLLTSYYEFNQMPIIDFSSQAHLLMSDPNNDKVVSYLCEDEYGTYLYTKKDLCALEYLNHLKPYDCFLLISNIFINQTIYPLIVDVFNQYLEGNISLDDANIALKQLNINYHDSFWDDDTIYTIKEAKALMKENENV